jgi:DNA-binding IclR family transcriptional regulator
MPSSPATTIGRATGGSPSNRSLERGIEVLRAFRPGSELLGNGEIADRTRLPKSTVSRLTQTLVGMGMLQAEPALRAYRLAPAVLSLAHAMRTGSRVLSVAAPMMQKLAERERLNVGLAAPDRDEMVYLESIRYNRRVALRNVVSGQRIPMELTSLGRAYLATLPKAARAGLMEAFSRRRAAQWPALKADILAAIEQVESEGFCAASWQPEIVALASPLAVDGATYVLNISLSITAPIDIVAPRLAPKLLSLRGQVLAALERAEPAAGAA